MALKKTAALYKNRYFRTNQKWVCGRAAIGHVCPRGPSRKGECSGAYECAPACVNGRWHCTRPAEYGGPCDAPGAKQAEFGPVVRDGVGVCARPVGCIPVRSLRSRRGLINIIVTAITLGLVLTALGSPWRNRIASPGSLTTFHAGATFDTAAARTGEGGASENLCGVCHTATLDDAFSTLFSQGPTGEEHRSESENCLQCHDDFGAQPLAPHSMDAGILAILTEGKGPKSPEAPLPATLALAAAFTIGNPLPSDQLDCATCHQEHKGRQNDLTQMDNNTCQACHENKFTGFESGHPEFSSQSNGDAYSWPYLRRTGLIFDHQRHANTHFKEGALADFSPTGCVDCHVFESENALPTLAPFEKTCGACHLKDILRASDDGLLFVGYPALEKDALEAISAEGYPRVKEASLSGFMLMLLSGDAAYGNEPARSAEQFDEDLATVTEFNRDLNEMIYEGEEDAALRVIESIGRLMDRLEAGSDDGKASPLQEVLEMITAAPGLGETDTAALLGPFNSGEKMTAIVKDLSASHVVAAQGWSASMNGSPLSKSEWSAAVAGVSEFDGLSESTEAAAFAKWFQDFTAFRPWFEESVRIADGRWTSKSTGRSLRASDWKKVAANAPGFAELDGDDEATEPFTKWFQSQSKFKKWLSSNVTINDQGWFAASSPYAVRYRPLGHADSFMRSWLDLSARLSGSNASAERLFRQLAGRAITSGAVGSCLRCHSVDSDSDSGLRINWTPRPARRSFTRFNHAPHQRIMSCSECHTATDAGEKGESLAAYLDGFRTEIGSAEIGVDFTSFTSNYGGIDKASCTRCHTPKQAGNRCLLCHNYHVDSFAAPGVTYHTNNQ